MKVLLIEDDIIWSSHLLNQLSKLGIEDVTTCENINDAIMHLSNKTPDIIISDILLGETTVFELFKHTQYLDIPCLFITTSESMYFYDLSKTMTNSGYLIKPFHPISLQAAIDKLLESTNKIIEGVTKNILVKGIYQEQIKIKASQVVYVKSERNYSFIKTTNNEFKIKSTLTSVHNNLGNELIQIHRSYLVNKSKINDINLSTMEVETNVGKIPIGITYKSEVLKLLSEMVQI